MEKILTHPKRRATVSLMEHALATYIQQAIERKYGPKPNKRQVAADCGVEYHVLIDVLRGKTARPAPDFLGGIADGLELSFDNLALAAYGRMPRGSIDPLTPPSVKEPALAH